MSLAIAKCWDNVALDSVAINEYALNALVDVIWVRNLDVVCREILHLYQRAQEVPG